MMIENNYVSFLEYCECMEIIRIVDDNEVRAWW